MFASMCLYTTSILVPKEDSWVLGIEPKSFGRRASAPNSWTLSSDTNGILKYRGSTGSNQVQTSQKTIWNHTSGVLELVHTGFLEPTA